ncbi:hypothetical protein JOQ06_021458 [Pogonophryne albipinna]|uniref:Uncharacterized protein n=1 Tax=Pogonophryne albipinna TaxID=1090488 RepID=A0AAD6A9I5_9TELE|nr:hypothetical protein JOQ06_021458 [Pogonophryne albipinna]
MSPHSSNIGFPSLDDEVASQMSYLNLNLTACDVPLPPNPKPAVLDKSKTREKKYPDQKTIGFPSLDEELASFTTQPLGVMACDIPLPPSTPPIEAVLYMLHCHEKILKSIGFRSLDENTNPKRPNVLPHEIPLPPNPFPDVLHKGSTPEKKNLDLKDIGFPSVDDEVACFMNQPYREKACDVSLTPSPTPADADADFTCHVRHFEEKKYPDLKSIGFTSLDDEVACCMSQPFGQAPLPPRPPPIELAGQIRIEKTHPDPLDDELACLIFQLRSQMSRDVPLSSSPAPACDVSHFEDVTLDDEFASVMTQLLKLIASDVPLPPSPAPADAACYIGLFQEKNYPDLKSIGFPSLEDEPKCPDMLPPPSPPPVELDKGISDDMTYSDLSVTGFPSMDDEVTCLMSQPLGVTASDVPLNPSAAPLDAACHVSHFQGMTYPDVTSIGFPSLDEDPKCPNLLPPEVTPAQRPLPSELDKGSSNEKTYPHLSVIGFPSLDDEVACLVPLSDRAFDVTVPAPDDDVWDSGDTNKKKNPGMNFRFSVPDVDRVQHCQVPLSSPTDAGIYKWIKGVKKHQNGQSIMFPSVDDVTKQCHMGFTHQKKQPDLMNFSFSVPDVDSLNQHQVPLSSPTDSGFYKWIKGVKKHQNGQSIMFPSVDDVTKQRHMGFTHQKKQPDLMNFSFSVPDVDSLQQHQVPLSSPTDSGFYKWNNGVKKHQNGQGVMFPSLDDDTEPSKQRHSGFTRQKEQPDVMNFSFSVPDLDTFKQHPTDTVFKKGNNGVKKHQNVERINFPSVDDDIEERHMGFTREKEQPDVMNFSFSVPDVDSLQQHQVPLSSPTDSGFYKWNNGVKKHQNGQGVMFPSLDDDTEPSKQRHSGFTRQKEQPDVMNFSFSVPDLDTFKQHPTDTVFKKGNNGVKKHQNVERINFPSVDDDIEERHMGFTREKEQPDLMNFSFSVPDVDSLQQHQVPLSSPTDSGFYKWNNGVQKHQNGQGVMFPPLDDDTEPSKQRHSGFTRQKEQPDVMNFSFSVPDVDPVTLCPPPVGMPQNAKEKYRDLCAVAFPCLD